jgi:hypothetical protein
MKKLLLLSLLTSASISPFTSNAQTTITESNFPRSGTFTHLYASSATNIVLPSIGSGEEWNYSNLSEEASLIFDYTDATGDTVFTNANNSRVWNYIFQGMTYSADHIDGIDANAWTSEGRRIYGEGYSITSVTGGANDSLIFLDHDDVFAAPHLNLVFPASFGNSWNSVYERELPFLLTVEGSGVVNNPGTFTEFRTTELEVVGDGTLIIPLSNGGAAPARDVILVKETLTEIDSVFLNGEPAPPTLMAAFGLTQGETTVITTYSFYTPDFGSALLVVSEGATMNFARYSKDVDNLSLNETMVSTAAYPNPVSGGSIFNIDFNSDLGKAEIKIVSMNGQVVYEGEEVSINSSLQFRIPESIEKGMYYIQINSNTSIINPVLIQIQ